MRSRKQHGARQNPPFKFLKPWKAEDIRRYHYLLYAGRYKKQPTEQEEIELSKFKCPIPWAELKKRWLEWRGLIKPHVLEPREYLTIQKAPEAMRDQLFINSDEHLRQHNRANWYGVHPHIMLFAGTFIQELRREGIPMFAHNAMRTTDQQLALYNGGTSSNPGPKAAHTVGGAVDIIHSRLYWEGMSKAEWTYLGIVGKKVAQRLNIPLVWGGDWSSPYDPAHWELRDWRTLEINFEPYVKRLTPTGLLSYHKVYY